MKKSIVFLATIIVATLILAAADFAVQESQSADVLFGKALHQEEVEGDYEAAIKTYEKLLSEFPDNRPLAAKAQFRIGVCFEKLGLKEAEKAFQKVVDNYPDQTDAVKQAREKLSILQRARAIVEKGDQGFKMTEIPIAPDKDLYSFISPDGKKLASVRGFGDIWVTDITSGQEIRLTQTPEFDFWCWWSPDSQKVAIMDAPNNLYVVSAKGGSLKTLIKHDEDFVKEYGGIWPLSWSPDSQNINCLFLKKGIVAIPTSGGEWKDIFLYSSPEQAESDFLPGTELSISPNEKYIAYTAKSENEDIYIMPTKGGEPAQITDHPAKDHGIGWLYDGRWLLFISNRNGKDEYWIIGISPDGKREGEPFQIPFLSTVPTNSALSCTHNNQIGLSYGEQISNLFVSNVDGSEKTQLTNLECGDWQPKWSPDNKYIAFVSSRGGKEGVWIVPVQGGEPKNISALLTERFGAKFTRGIAWHPDARRVSCWTYDGAGRDPWTMDIHTGEVQRIPFDYDGHMKSVDWSPDGKRIAFSYSSSGTPNAIKDSELMKSNIYTVNAEGGEPIRLTREEEDGSSFHYPRWSPDGQRIAFMDDDGRIWTVGSEGGEPQLITDKSGPRVAGISGYNWSPDGEEIYYFRHEKGKKQPKTIICSVSSQGGEPRIINKIEGGRGELSPDGKRIVYGKIMKIINQYWLLENFLPEKKKD
jgi:Tol biopolymer transport system component